MTSIVMETIISTIQFAPEMQNDLPPVVFHSFRHASVPYKLKFNGGDIKAVQGDTGHSQTKMVTDVYSHILDDGRQNNAALFQEAIYEKGAPSDEIPQDKLAKLLSDPEVAALLKTLWRHSSRLTRTKKEPTLERTLFD